MCLKSQNPRTDWKNDTEIIVLDGGMGTWLEDNYKVIFDDTKPAWSSSVSPHLLCKVHCDYIQAGAEIILTGTYQATMENMTSASDEQPGLASKRRMRQLVQAAKEAVSRHETPVKPLSIALSLGPYGATMKPSTEYSGEYAVEMQAVEQLRAWHAARLDIYAFSPGKDVYTPTNGQPILHSLTTENALQTAASYSGLGDIDYFAFETLVGVNEILAVRRAMYDFNRKQTRGQSIKKWWISVNYPHDGPSDFDGPLAPQRQTTREIVRAMVRSEPGCARPWAIGINCTKISKLPRLVELYEDAISEIRNEEEDRPEEATEWPSLILYPDGAQNLNYNTQLKRWEQTAEINADSRQRSWAEQVLDGLKVICGRGAWQSIIVGGCCKTTPADIKELSTLVNTVR